MLAFSLGLLIASYSCAPWSSGLPVVIAVVALLLMMLGIADDLLVLPASCASGVYGLVCAPLLVACPCQLPGTGLLHPAMVLVVALAMLWLVNLYNLWTVSTASPPASACWPAARRPCCPGNGAADYALFCLLLGASQLGFLVELATGAPVHGRCGQYSNGLPAGWPGGGRGGG